MGNLEGLYKQSPTWLQNAMVSSYGTYWRWARFSGSYKQHEDGYRLRESFDLPGWQQYQQQQLKGLLSICVRHVPYYRQNWSLRQVKLAAENGQLEGIPFLEKDAIRANADQFLRQDQKPFPNFRFHTSGTTGTPIDCTYSLSELRNSMALREVRSANWAGVSFRLPRATFSGRMAEPDPDSKGPYYRYNAAERQVYFSAFHLRPDTARDYVEALHRHKVQWMTGYAVSYYLLAKFILDQKIQVPPLKAIITTSEKLTLEMRRVMQDAYHCRVYQEYSTVENALFASECELGRLHVSPDAAVVEILRPDGCQCEAGEVGEVVTTCLMRTYQPLVRFRLGDLASWDPQPCPCGRSMPVIQEVVGRIEDVVIGSDGRQMVRFHGIFVDQPHVIEGQIIQETLSTIMVKVVPTANFNGDDVQDIIHRVQQRMGHEVHVQVECVNEIPRTASGKFQAVISKVPS